MKGLNLYDAGSCPQKTARPLRGALSSKGFWNSGAYICQYKKGIHGASGKGLVFCAVLGIPECASKEITPKIINMSPEKGTISIGNVIFRTLIFRGYISFSGEELPRFLFADFQFLENFWRINLCPAGGRFVQRAS